MNLLRRLCVWLYGLLRAHLFAGSFLFASGLVALWLTVIVIIPSFRSPANSTYDTKYGYLAMERKLGRPFAVVTSVVATQVLPRNLIGEGLIAAEPIAVPIIPLAPIKKVYGEKGDYVHKGQLLVELDDAKQQIKIRTAEYALKTSKAELERVMIGSAYVLAQERPTKDRINLDAAQSTLTIQKNQLQVLRDLQKSGAIGAMTVFDQEKLVVAADQERRQAEFNLGMSSQGQDQSRLIAQTAIDDAQNTLDHRQLELKDYKIYAPADGIVEEIVVHDGEYNQDTGRPCMIIASGLWFEAHLGQSLLNQIQVGDESIVFLEAFPGGRLSGRITRIVPVVSPSAGGPESTRPIRPMGSGAPEWPCTFTVRIEVAAPENIRLAPGLTGFARIEAKRMATVIPRKALLSFSGGQAIVHVVRPQREIRTVQVGASSDDWVEIVSGLLPGDVIISEGHEGLTVTDRIQEMPPIAVQPDQGKDPI